MLAYLVCSLQYLLIVVVIDQADIHQSEGTPSPCQVQPPWVCIERLCALPGPRLAVDQRDELEFCSFRDLLLRSYQAIYSKVAGLQVQGFRPPLASDARKKEFLALSAARVTTAFWKSCIFSIDPCVMLVISPGSSLWIS